MTGNITFRADYAGFVDETKVAWTYKAYAKEGQPYVIVLDDLDPLIDNPLSAVLVPTDGDTATLDDCSEMDAEEFDRKNAVAWVDALTELVAKAAAYDEIMGEDDEEDEYADLVLGNCDWAVTEDSVDNLLQLNALPGVWEDVEGDFYLQDHNGEWYQGGGDANGPWERLEVQTSFLLSCYGPYTRVGSDSTVIADYEEWDLGTDDDDSAFVVESLTDAERDAEWEDVDGDCYKCIDGEWNILYRTEDDYEPIDDADYLTAYGPYRVVGK